MIERQIERLHAEVMHRISAFANLWRTALLGIAAVALLTKDQDLSLVLLLTPPLLGLLLAYWLNEQAGLVYVAHAIAAEEAKLNRLFGREVLEYETNRVQQRRAELRGWSALALATLLLAVYTVGVSAVYPHAAQVRGYDIQGAYVALSVATGLIVAINMFRFWRLSRAPTGALSAPWAAPDPTPAVNETQSNAKAAP